MSIISRLMSNGHLDDARFAALWADLSLTGRPPVDDHLEACAHCQSRFEAFSRWMEDVRADAGADADEAFPAERLAAQHAAVMRRLAAAQHPARVIAFPHFARPISSNASHARRWIATAAAAGLIVGVGLGQLMDLRHLTDRAQRQTVDTAFPTASPMRPNPNVQPVSASLTDVALMAQIEDIGSQSVPDSLMALDSMTPRARDFTDRPR